MKSSLSCNRFTVGLLIAIAVSGCSRELPEAPEQAAIEGPDSTLEKTGTSSAPRVADAAPVEDHPTAPSPPVHPAPLPVTGYADASHIGPDGKETWPRPVTVVLHGNFDRPQWQCATWREVASWRGWVLCPRGVPTPWATAAEDRWTYRGGAAAVQREIAAGLAALEERYPGKVASDSMVLAGFSLGAILAPRIAVEHPDTYPFLFLAEGGEDALDGNWPRRLRGAGVVGIGLAMSGPGLRRIAMDALPRFQRAGISAVFVDMKGAGHDYRSDFGVTGRAALQDLLGASQD